MQTLPSQSQSYVRGHTDNELLTIAHRTPSGVSSSATTRMINHLHRPSSLSAIQLLSPPCTLGITVGSERGSYVPQRHVLRRIGRPHHVVNLMFQHYPDMKDWPVQGVNYHGFYRNRQLNSGDGYFPLSLDSDGLWGQEFARQIADVRAYGSEPQLTLTLHADTPDATLIRIAEALRPFTPMRIRINHECNGTWFHFNERWTYAQVSALFVRFHNILHQYAPGVQTVACWNGNAENLHEPADRQPPRGRLTDDELGPAFRVADIVSIDQYASLHYGWPDPSFDPASPSQFFKVDPEAWWTEMGNIHAAICQLRGSDTDIEIHEVNDDADIVGDEGQAAWIRRFYREVTERALPWLRNITFYQFRDRGGLGLERESLPDPDRYEDLPSLAAYRQAIDDSYFALRSHTLPGSGGVTHDLELSWSGPTEATGLRVAFDNVSTSRIDLILPTQQHVLVRDGAVWHAKPVGKDHVTLGGAAQDDRCTVDIFLPPPDGRNNRSHSFVSRLQAEPMLRMS